MGLEPAPLGRGHARQGLGAGQAALVLGAPVLERGREEVEEWRRLRAGTDGGRVPPCQHHAVKAGAHVEAAGPAEALADAVALEAPGDGPSARS